MPFELEEMTDDAGAELEPLPETPASPPAEPEQLPETPVEAVPVEPDDLAGEEQALQTVAPDDPGADATAAGPHPAEVCQALFASGLSSISVDSAFDQMYRGQRVRWQGLLRSLSRYSYDPALGDGPALKVHLDLMEIEADYGSRRMVEVIVRMPLGSEELLAGCKGKTITFSGELHRADGLMYRVYLTAGEVLMPLQGPGAGRP
jgi:hypothetical protein